MGTVDYFTSACRFFILIFLEHLINKGDIKNA